MSVLKCTYMQQHANTTMRMMATRTADETAPPKEEADTLTSSEWTSDVGGTSDAADEPRSEKCSGLVRNNSVDDDAGAGVGS